MTVSPRLLAVSAVVKIGGGLLDHPAQLDAVVATVERIGASRRLVVVPGGGLFADAVRAADGRFGLPDDAAHWMAVLAMDQHAYLLRSRFANARLVTDGPGIGVALDRGALPVLAPFRWLHDVDPLPHSWAVTSDSIAAWLAGALGARHLVLVKPPGADTTDAVDAYFDRALPPGVSCAVVAADQVTELAAALAEQHA